MQDFLNKYANELHNVENALSDALSEVSDPNTDPVGISIVPYEQTNILQLVRTENKLFNKVIVVFASLCLEIQKLKELVKKRKKN
jgi:WASH complex subunit 7